MANEGMPVICILQWQVYCISFNVAFEMAVIFHNRSIHYFIHKYFHPFSELYTSFLLCNIKNIDLIFIHVFIVKILVRAKQYYPCSTILHIEEISTATMTLYDRSHEPILKQNMFSDFIIIKRFWTKLASHK